VGGSIETEAEDRSGTRAAERVFEVLITPRLTDETPVLIGQRVVVRFDLQPKAVALQWWGTLRRLLQKRFQV
jgi:hypothetical protein